MKLDLLDLDNKRIGIIKDAYDVHIEYELGAWDVLKFCLPITSKAWIKIKEEVRVRYDDKFYVIRSTGAKLDNSGVRHQELTCPSIASDLNYKYNQVLDITGLATVLMDKVLEKSGWSRGTVSLTGGKSRTLQNEWNSVTANLRSMAEKFTGYLFYHSDTLKVDLIENPGEDNGVTIQVGKNIVDLSRDTDSEKLVTRLYCYGSDDMTFNSVNPGKPISAEMKQTLIGLGYSSDDIDHQISGINQSFIQDFTYYINMGYQPIDIYVDILENGEASRFLKVDKLSDPDYVTEDAFLQKCLETMEELKLPKFTYTMSIVDLSQLSGHSAESFSIGDWIYVYDELFNIDIKARISKMTIYPGFPDKTQVEISNIKNQLSDILSDAIQISSMLGESSGVSNLVKGLINTFATTINSADGSLSWSDGVLEAIDNIDPNKRVRLTAGGLGVSKDAGQTYANAITGDGILANHIIVTDDINLFSGDKRTMITGSGIEVYTDAATPVKAIHIGNYATGRHGIWINAGHIEMVGSLADSNIPDISANKIVGGTLAATSRIYVGENENIWIDGLLDKISIYDDDPTPVERVRLGKIGTGAYGLEVMDMSGNTMFSSVDKMLHIASGGTLIIGRDETDFELKFDGTDLIFGPGAIKWANLDPLVQQNLMGPAGPPGAEGPPGDPGADGSDADIPNWVTAWNSGSTEIYSGYIMSPKMFIGQGGQIATGLRFEASGILAYSANEQDGFSLTQNGTLELWYQGARKGQIDYDQSGVTPDNPNRMFIRSLNGTALKLESSGEMSIEAKTGKIHVTSEMRCYDKLDLSNSTLDLTGTTLIGMPAGMSVIAKFK